MEGSDIVYAPVPSQASISTSDPPGTTVMEVVITPSVVERLASMAAAHQEIKYNYIEFELTGGGSAITRGLGTMAFCADPVDIIPPISESTAWANTQETNVTGKYNETITMRVPAKSLTGPFGGFFKTNVGPNGDLRQVSPGFLAYIVGISPSDDIGLQVKMNWGVTLRTPTLLKSVEDIQLVRSEADFQLPCSDSSESPFVGTLQRLTPGTTTFEALAADDFSPPLEVDTYYSIPGGQVALIPNTETEIQLGTAMASHIGLVGQEVRLFRYDILTAGFAAVTASTKPSCDTTPTFRSEREWLVDASSPSRVTLGFQRLSLRPSGSPRTASSLLQRFRRGA